ncbi:MAG: hypothetical protein LBH97_02620 [Treponema sp.]|jgi:hypothetical protein|nr:hypothetical protein [Treponema sp.]
MRKTQVKTIAVIFLLMSLAAFVCAQENGVRVIVQSSPDNPIAGSHWSLSILIKHPEPEEVTVMAPPFTGLLLLDQVSRVPRIVNDERWTAMEYRFSLQGSGTAELEPFIISTPQGSAETAPLAIRVQRAQGRIETLRPRLAWEGLPASLSVGESAVFSLRISGWNSQMPLPPSQIFMPVIPPGVILESLLLAPDERAAGLALRLRLIPLSAEIFNLPRRTVSQENAVFEIPALRIPVNPARSATRDSASASTVADVSLAADVTIPFPSLESAAGNHPSLFNRFRNECETIYAAAKRLWEQGSRANALAELRRRERDHSAGPLFAFLRREAEQGLGLEQTKIEEKKSLLPWRRHSGSGVMKESSVHRIPDPAGGEIARFREGQPVRLLPGERRTGSGWVRVTSHDDSGVSGWVPEEKIIFY